MLVDLSVGLLPVRTGPCECLDLAIGPSVACGGLFGHEIGLGLGPKFEFKIGWALGLGSCPIKITKIKR